MENREDLIKNGYILYTNEKNEIIGVLNINKRYIAYNKEEVLRINDKKMISDLYAGELRFNPYGVCEEFYDIKNYRKFTYGSWSELSSEDRERYAKSCEGLYTQDDFDVIGKYCYEDNSCYSLD